MEFKELYRKKVVILTPDGEIYSGTVTDYMDPEDNNPPLESIIIDEAETGRPIEFFHSDVEKIDVIGKKYDREYQKDDN